LESYEVDKLELISMINHKDQANFWSLSKSVDSIAVVESKYVFDVRQILLQ
jgi:hypothetical protein